MPPARTSVSNNLTFTLSGSYQIFNGSPSYPYCPSSRENELQLNPTMSNSVISNSPLSQTELDSLGFALVFFSVIYYGLSRTQLSRTPRYLEMFLSRTLLRSEETLVDISEEVQPMHLLTRCTESWQMYWRVHGNEAKSNWLDLLLRMQKATSCRYLLILGVKLLLPKFWRQPRSLEAPLSGISIYNTSE